MVKKIYYLSTCDTCKKIIALLDLKNKNFEFQDLKFKNISENELNEIATRVGGYEPLFSKTARKYKELNLKEKKLSETEFKNFILNEYTFLKRPVIIFGENIFIGNSKNTIEQANKTIV
ncbi:MAG: arsenate reductase [Bacteroidetes bacterium]|nr:arsenate reductase [Bacteroidota bacterium]